MDKSQTSGSSDASPSTATSSAEASTASLVRAPSTSSLRRVDSNSNRLTPQPSATNSNNTSATASPFASREPSPIRLVRPGPVKAASTGTAPAARSRKNSQTDTSPGRQPRSSLPAPSPSQRTITAANTPTLQPVASDSTPRSTGPQKSSDPARESPRWPISPRLRSPPPVLNKPSFAPARRGMEQDPPSISVQRSTPSPQPRPDGASLDNDLDDTYLQPGMRTPARGGSTSTLETVQEVSPLGSPQVLDDALEKLQNSIASTSETSTQPDAAQTQTQAKLFKTNPSLAHNESGGESGSSKADRRPTTNSAPPPLTSRQSSTSMKASTGKGKPAEGSLPTMTVETETVTSIPQVAVAPSATQASSSSLRTKPSSETIRPKKEKKKASRKPPVVAPGTASSKADIFAAKVASAVDEADTSDSEETFVYDSNPPDNRDRPHRFHSRTPSATSMASQVDRTGLRSIHSVMDGPGPSAAVRKNMKFVSTINSGTDSAYGDDEGKGTGRSNAGGSARGTARHHHFRGWGRAGGNGHASILDADAPFTLNSAKSKFGGNQSTASRQSSGPPSPRLAPRGGANGKRGFPFPSYIDLDETPGADDERTPLIGSSIRSGRSSRTRRRPHTLRTLEQQSYQRVPASFLNRFATCLVLTVMLVLVVSGAIGFMFATSQPLEDIELVKISNIIASEQELMFDLMVRARNPNVVVVSVDAADLEVFAKSPFAGDTSAWPDGVPPDDDEASPNFLLGQITVFSSPLSFEGSFFHGGLSSSTGSVRLRQPGNGTEQGTKRWAEILSKEFELIVNGVLKYSLPLSQRVKSARISGRQKVKPNSANDPPALKPNETALYHLAG